MRLISQTFEPAIARRARPFELRPRPCKRPPTLNTAQRGRNGGT